MIKLNDEQQQALDAMMVGRNVFLTGEAGTGKSTGGYRVRHDCHSKMPH